MNLNPPNEVQYKRNLTLVSEAVSSCASKELESSSLDKTMYQVSFAHGTGPRKLAP
jgi:hypothetical protein